jgi:hypothetical protein
VARRTMYSSPIPPTCAPAKAGGDPDRTRVRQTHGLNCSITRCKQQLRAISLSGEGYTVVRDEPARRQQVPLYGEVAERPRLVCSSATTAGVFSWLSRRASRERSTTSARSRAVEHKELTELLLEVTGRDWITCSTYLTRAAAATICATRSTSARSASWDTRRGFPSRRPGAHRPVVQGQSPSGGAAQGARGTRKDRLVR